MYLSCSSLHARCALVTGVQTCAVPISPRPCPAPPLPAPRPALHHRLPHAVPGICLRPLADPAGLDLRADAPVPRSVPRRDGGNRVAAEGAAGVRFRQHPRVGARRRPGAVLSAAVDPRPAAPGAHVCRPGRGGERSEEHTSELPSLMRISYAVFFLKKKKEKYKHLNKRKHKSYIITQHLHQYNQKQCLILEPH